MRTRGCVAFDNDALVKFGKLIGDKGVVIISESEPVDAGKNDIARVLAHLQEWLQMWRDNETKIYLNFYTDKFMKIDGKNALTSEGYIVSRPRRGFYVAALSELPLRNRQAAAVRRAQPPGAPGSAGPPPSSRAESAAPTGVTQGSLDALARPWRLDVGMTQVEGLGAQFLTPGQASQGNADLRGPIP